jgi:hypothetical protein
MARSTTDVCLSLRTKTLRAVDAAAQAAQRSRSQFVDLTLERAMTGAGRLEALQGIADQGLEHFAADHSRKSGPNPGQVIAAAATAGHDALRAHQQIAAGSSERRVQSQETLK